LSGCFGEAFNIFNKIFTPDEKVTKCNCPYKFLPKREKVKTRRIHINGEDKNVFFKSGIFVYVAFDFLRKLNKRERTYILPF